jgi:hypothetical protein
VSDLLKRHLDAIAASVHVTIAHVEAARHALTLHVDPPAATLPLMCTSVPAEQCARRDMTAGRSVMGGGCICGGCGAHIESSSVDTQ